MDWASSQWKEGLSSVALQKINALEEKIEKLQKERQQKQVQFECLEITLDKEKRKVEQEKQQTVRLERDLQSLGDTCKNLENKQQKLLNEIQNRDARLNSLEGQLSQAKKQNCRLQQLENDIEELRCLRDSSRLEQKELEEKLKREQSMIMKQNDAISDLEQTIKTLQDKSVLSEKSFLSIADKENINVSHSNNDESSEFLRKKIVEQENTIKSLKDQLKNISSTKENMAPPVLSTPRKSHNGTTETPLKNSYSFWDGFGSTPAKTGNRAAKHVNESSTFDDSDEKVHTLQLKLKQISQELECQRHNHEAAKNALEQRSKERENSLKEEVKQQAQTIFDLDRELRELKNKYQQDVIQANKKLDVVNVQLQKCELSKQQIEKDLKTLEQQISSKNSSLQQKDDELKELQKVKNSLEAASKQMQSDKRQLEKTNSALQTQKTELNEQIKDIKRQLDGSNNLVKEKDALIQNMKKEQDNLTRMNSELERKIEISNKKLSDAQSEKCELEKQLKHLNNDIVSLNKNLENVSEEKKNACKMLDLEKGRNGKLEYDLAESNKEKHNLQVKMKASETTITALTEELGQLKVDSSEKIEMLNKKLSEAQLEKCELEKQCKQLSNDILSLNKNLENLSEEKNNARKMLDLEKMKCEQLQNDLTESNKEKSILQAKMKASEDSVTTLKEELEQLKVESTVKVTQLEGSLSSSKEEISTLKNMLEESSSQIRVMQENLDKLHCENERISNLLTSANTEKEAAESKIEEMKSQLMVLQADVESKERSIIEMKNAISEASEKYNIKVSQLEGSLSSSNEEISALKNTLEESSGQIRAMQENLEKFHCENEKISNLLVSSNAEKEAAESKVEEMKSQLMVLQADVESKETSIVEMKKAISEESEKYNIKVTQLEGSLSSSNEEISTLKNMLEESSDQTRVMQENLNKLHCENERISNLLNSANTEKEAAESKVEEMKSQLMVLQADVESKETSILQMKKALSEASEKYNVQVQHFEFSLATLNEENANLKNSLKESTEKLNVIQSELNEQVSENKRISSLIESENSEKEAAVSKSKELESQYDTLLSDIQSREDTIVSLKKELTESEVQVKQLEDSLVTSNEENANLKNSLKESTEKLNVIQSELNELASENKRISSLIESENSAKEAAISRSKELESQYNTLLSDIQSREDTIIFLKKELAESEVQVKHLEDSLATLNKENSNLNNSLKESTEKLNVIQSELNELACENKRISSLVESEDSEKEAALSKFKELESQYNTLLSNIQSREDNIICLKKEMAESKEKHDIEVQQLQSSLASSNEEILRLKNMLEESSGKITDLQGSLDKFPFEMEKLSSLLNSVRSEKEAAECKVEEMKSNLLVLQSVIESKEANILQLSSYSLEAKAIYEGQIKVLEETLTTTNEENTKLINLLRESTEKIDTVQSQLDKVNNDKEAAESETKELKSQLESVQLDIESRKAKDEEIQKLNLSLSSLNEENVKLKKELCECSDKLETMQKNIDKLDEENKVIKKLLESSNTGKEAAESRVEEIQLKLSALQSDIEFKETNFVHFEKEMVKAKEKFNENLRQLEISLASVNEENSSLKNKIKEYTGKIREFQENIDETDCESTIMLDLYNSAVSAKEAAESKIEDIKSQLSSAQFEVECKEVNILNLESELIEIEKMVDNKKSQLSCYIQDVTSNFSSMQACVQEIGSKSQIMQKEISLLMEEDQKHKKEFLYDLLNHLNSIEKHAEEIKNNYESKIFKLLENEEFLAAEINSLRLQLEEITSREINLKKNLEGMELKNCKEDELKAKMCDLTEALALKVHQIKSLEEEIITLKNVNANEKLQFNSYIQDITSGIVSVQSCVQEINSKSILMQNEIGYLKEDDQKLKGEILHDLLNQLDLIEKHAEETKNIYEEKLSHLHTRLNKLELNLFEKNQLCTSVMLEKEKLLEELRIIQEKLSTKEVALESCCLTVSNQLTAIEILKTLNESLVHEKNEITEEISHLKDKLVEIESMTSVTKKENNNLKEGKEKMVEELELIREKLSAKEIELEALTIEIKSVQEDLDTMVGINADNLANIGVLKEANRKLIQENDELQGQISGFGDKLAESEFKIELLKKENINLREEREKLMEEFNLTLGKLSAKESELKELESVKDTETKVLESQEKLIQENKEFQGRISDLGNKLAELGFKIEMLKKENITLKEKKGKLVEELKLALEKFSLKELELTEVSSVKDVEIKDLKETQEKFIKENKDLQVQVLDLGKKLVETESMVSTFERENSYLIEEKAKLLKELEVSTEKLSVKESELKELVSVKEIHSDCNKSIKFLKEEHEKLIQENSKLKVHISDLENKLTETESMATIFKEENNHLKEETGKLMEKLELSLGKLSVRDSELEEFTLIKDIHSDCEKNFEILGKVQVELIQENNELQTKLSAIAQDITTAKEALSSIGFQMKDIFSLSKNAFHSVQEIEQKRKSVSDNLEKLKNDYCHSKIINEEDKRQVETLSHLVLYCIELFEESLAKSKEMEVPVSVTEVTNNYLSWTTNPKSVANSCCISVEECDNQIPLLEQRQMAVLEHELNASFIQFKNDMDAFEEKILSEKERFKFLVYHHLVDAATFKKMLVTLKFLRKLYTTIHSKKLALKLLQISKFHFSPSHQSFKEEVDVINKLSDDLIETEARLFFEKYLLINSYKDVYISFKLKLAFNSMADFVSDKIIKYSQHVSFLMTYGHVDIHPSHLPVIIKTNLFLLHSISSAYFVKENVSEDICLMGHYKYFDFGKILSNMSTNKVPLILSSFLKLIENSQSNLECHVFDKKLFCSIVDMIITQENNSFHISIKTVKCFENILSFTFKDMRYHFDSYLKELEDLIYHLIHDFSTLSFSVLDRSQNIEKTSHVLSDLSNEVINLKSECINKQNEIDGLLALLESEKDNRDVLDRHVKEINLNFDTISSQNEDLKIKICEVSKLCHVIKIISSDSCDIQQLQSEFATLSDTFCLCDDCMMMESDVQNNPNHEHLTPVKLIHFIAKLFTLKTDYEKEIVKLNEAIGSLRQDILKLEDEKSVLEHSAGDLKKCIALRETELSEFKTKYDSLLEVSNNEFFSKIDIMKKDHEKHIGEISDRLGKARKQYEEVLSENQQLKEDLVEKEVKIAQCEIIVKEKESECESLTNKCEQNETKLKDINSTITELTSALNETKNKVATLEKSNNLLNVTLENVEEELQNIYSEKQKIEENLQVKSDEIESLYQELKSWKSKASGEEGEISCLQNSIKELQATIQELQNKNVKLQNDFAQSSVTEKELKKSNLEKNLCIQKKSDEIDKLNQEIKSWKSKTCDLEKEISCLQTSIKELQATIQELQNKNAKLQNDFAQPSITEKELKKSILEKNLCIQKKSDEINKLHLDIKSWKSKASELESEISGLQTSIKELQNSDVKLQNDLAKSRIAEKEYKKSLLEKNFSIQQKEFSVKELKEKLAESTTEKQNLVMKVTNLENKLQELKNKYDKVITDNEKLDKEISDLLLLKNERTKLLQDIKELKMKCEEYIQENKSLKLELEKLILEKSNHENETRALIDKISDIEKELKKAVHLKEDIIYEKEKLRRELESTRKSMQCKSSESSLLIQELQQKLDELTKKDLEKDQVAEKKINELILENNSLLEEINSLKVQSSMLLKDTESEVNYKKNLSKLIDMLSEIINKLENNSSYDQVRTELLSDLSDWENKVLSVSFFSEIQMKLESIFSMLTDKQKEIEHTLSEVYSIASNYVAEISQLCQSADMKFKPNLDSTVLFNKSCFDVTLCNNKTLLSEGLESVTAELSESCKMLTSHFKSMNEALLKKEIEVSSLKEALVKNEMEIKSLKESLEKAKTLATGSTSSEKQSLTLENRCKLLTSNCRRLEKKHLQLLKTNEEMEKRIKALEQEKVELEAEAEEMAAIIKQHNSSDELLETNNMLSKCSKELRQLKHENECLKISLKSCEKLCKELSINTSKFSELGESSQNNL